MIFLRHAWLRSSLLSLLQHHMAYSIPKYGTLVYCYGGDLVHALTVALGQCHHTNTQLLIVSMTPCSHKSARVSTASYMLR